MALEEYKTQLNSQKSALHPLTAVDWMYFYRNLIENTLILEIVLKKLDFL